MNWTIPKMWEGGECWIIGGGPSIPQQFGIPEDVVEGVLARALPLKAYSPYLSAIHNKHVIGINVAFMLGTWVDIVFFGDARFYLKYSKELAEFSKLKVCCNPNLLKRPNVHKVKYTLRNGKRLHGITFNGNGVSWNNNSGAAAISLAVQLGVVRIYLLGFDMSLGATGVQHWHNQYGRGINGGPKKLPFERHLRSFPAIAKDAESLGIEIINVSPDSAITVFPRRSLKEVLCVKDN